MLGNGTFVKLGYLGLWLERTLCLACYGVIGKRLFISLGR